MTTIHVCTAKCIDRVLVRHDCPTCDKRRYFLCWFYEWYGWTLVCLRCGERWGDDEMLPRPFVPGWRKMSVENAKRQWREGSDVPGQEVMEFAE